VQGDLSDRHAIQSACDDCDTVFHVAARTGIWGSTADYVRDNVLGTRNVIDACLAVGVDRLIFTSSASVVFRGCDLINVDENLPYPTRWLNAYCKSKCIAEQMVLAADGASNKKRVLRTCALRPHTIWGPGDRHILPRLIKAAISGRLWRIGRGNNMIDHVFIKDCVAAHISAANALDAVRSCGRAYFITAGEPINCWEWIKEIAEAAGGEVRESIPQLGAELLASLCEVVYSHSRRISEPFLTRYSVALLARSHYFNIERARRELAFAPTCTIEQHLPDTVVSVLKDIR
jgi:nucleoside-diphosphate-sugar epimerase